MKTSLKSLLEAFKMVKAADPKVLESLNTDEALTKAAQNLTESEMVSDRWQAGQVHQGANKEQIKTGPQAQSSGDGAERMVAHYSDTQAQHGTTLTAESLSRILGPINSSMKSLIDVVTVQQKQITAMSEYLKAEAEKEEDEDSDSMEESEEKAKAKIKKAKRLISKAEDADDKAETKSYLKKAGVELGFALYSALEVAGVTGDNTLAKSIREIAKEAGIKVVAKAEDEEKDEEKKDDDAEKAKTDADAAAKALADAAAAATAAPDAAAKAIADLPNKMKTIDEALLGLTVLSTTVKGMMDVISGKAKVSDLVPDFSKAAPEQGVTVEHIEKAVEAGALSDSEGDIALDVLSKFGAVNAGTLPAEIAKSRLDRAPTAVKALFADKKAA